MIKIFATERDDVIKSAVATAVTDYQNALDHFYPLLDRFGEQRKTQGKKFYARLRKDILNGCIMPPITLAFVSPENSDNSNIQSIQAFVNENVKNGYVLDGMQRLNTLMDASGEPDFDNKRPIFLTVIIAERYDLLLYRMITLNNGQKPMTARHQIEMLTQGVIDLSGLSIQIVTEKETEGTKIVGAFRKSDIVEAYTAYLTNSVNNQNSKIIEAKLDEIIVGKVMESNILDSQFTFSEILKEVDRLSHNNFTKEWLRQVNNLIGFTVGVKTSLAEIQNWELPFVEAFFVKFEAAFEAINPSKVNVGKFRRELSAYYIANANQYMDADVSDVEGAFFEQTLVE